MKRLALGLLASAFLLQTSTWAVPGGGAAHLSVRGARSSAWAAQTAGVAQTAGANRVSGQAERAQTGAALPSAAYFREAGGRGLLVKTWVNGAGPYNFALDTGAGSTILSGRVAAEARVAPGRKGGVRLGGLSGAGTIAGREVSLRSLAVGYAANLLPSKGLVIVAEGLPPDLDGVLDPVEAYSPLGFEIDLPRGEITAFDPRQSPLRRNRNLPPDAAIVSWLLEPGSRRPFVMLDGGRRALLDTGSGFGLAVTEEAARALGVRLTGGANGADVRDIGGGRIGARRVAPATIGLGPLVLRGIPTDLLLGAEAGAPVILGRQALRPFRLMFDPLSRLIRIMPG